MSARELLDAGRLTAALKQVTDEVRSDPANSRPRIFLFELLCFSGDLDRSQKQLEAFGQDSAETEIAVQSYINLLAAEKKRRSFFKSGLRPKLTASVSYAATQFAAIDRYRSGDMERARELLEEVEENRPAVRGTINGQAFDDFKDADDLIGPFAEAIIQNEYCWVPWETIASVNFSKPKYLRDLMWIPGHLELTEGTAGEVYFPVLYADSWEHNDESVKLGRKTLWREDVEGLSIGVGQKTFLAGELDYALLEIETLELDHADAYAGH